MRVFLTGATGFIGANIARQLISDGYEVRALVRKGADARSLKGLSLETAEGDLGDRKALAQSMKGCDSLMHVAAHYSLWKSDAAALYHSNVEGTQNILDAAADAGINRIVYTSSVAALGVPPNGTTADESLQTTVDDLVSEYKKSKYLAEQVARRKAREGMNVVIVNPSTPVGPYDIKPTPTGEIILRFLNRKMPAYVDTGLNLIDVADVARGHILALERGKPGERYILGNRNMTFKQLLEILGSITGLKPPTVRVPHWIPLLAAYVDEGILARLGKQPGVSIYSVKMSRKAMYYDSAKAIRELGLPQTPVEQALESAVRWFRDNGYVKQPGY